MDWLNLHHSVLDSEAVVGSEPVDRATWLFLLRYCMGQENGGVIVGASEWGDRRWQQLCRVTEAEVNRDSDLWHWIDGDLHVHAYPIEKQVEVQAKRNAGRLGGQAKTEAKTQAARANGMVRSQAEAKQKPSSDPTEGKGKEWKGSGREDASPPPPPSISQGVDTSTLLAEFGIPNSAKAAAEWCGGLNRVACCRSLDEARAFLRWAITVCAMNDLKVEYWRHVKNLAQEWDTTYRASHWKAA